MESNNGKRDNVHDCSRALVALVVRVQKHFGTFLEQGLRTEHSAITYNDYQKCKVGSFCSPLSVNDIECTVASSKSVKIGQYPGKV